MKDSIDNINDFIDKILSYCAEHNTINEIFYLNEFRMNLENNYHKVIFVGSQKSGKSTLINCILTYKVLPTGSAPVTNNIIEISKGEPSNIVHFGDNSFKYIEYNDIMTYCSEKLNSHNVYNVRKIQIKMNSKIIPDKIIFVDTPGSNSTYLDHDEVIYNNIYGASLIIFVLPDRPINNTEVSMLKKIDRINNRAKILVLMNKKDMLNDETEIEELSEYNIKMLNNHVNFDFFAVSAKDLAIGLHTKNTELIKNSNIPKFMRYVKDINYNYDLSDISYILKHLLIRLKFNIEKKINDINSELIKTTKIIDLLSEMKNDVGSEKYNTDIITNEIFNNVEFHKINLNLIIDRLNYFTDISCNIKSKLNNSKTNYYLDFIDSCIAATNNHSFTICPFCLNGRKKIKKLFSKTIIELIEQVKKYFKKNEIKVKKYLCKYCGNYI